MEANVFERHRKNILNQMNDNSLMIIFSRPKEDSIVNQKYNVNRNYSYLCGILEYENIILLSKINGHTSEMVFIHPYDEFKAKWVGAPLDKSVVEKISGIKNVRYLDTFDSLLARMLEAVEQVLSLIHI